jgi:hypothetical protein
MFRGVDLEGSYAGWRYLIRPETSCETETKQLVLIVPLNLEDEGVFRE